MVKNHPLKLAGNNGTTPLGVKSMGTTAAPCVLECTENRGQPRNLAIIQTTY